MEGVEEQIGETTVLPDGTILDAPFVKPTAPIIEPLISQSPRPQLKRRRCESPSEGDDHVAEDGVGTDTEDEPLPPLTDSQSQLLTNERKILRIIEILEYSQQHKKTRGKLSAAKKNEIIEICKMLLGNSFPDRTPESPTVEQVAVGTAGSDSAFGMRGELAQIRDTLEKHSSLLTALLGARTAINPPTGLPAVNIHNGTFSEVVSGAFGSVAPGSSGSAGFRSVCGAGSGTEAYPSTSTSQPQPAFPKPPQGDPAPPEFAAVFTVSKELTDSGTDAKIYLQGKLKSPLKVVPQQLRKLRNNTYRASFPSAAQREEFKAVVKGSDPAMVVEDEKKWWPMVILKGIGNEVAQSNEIVSQILSQNPGLHSMLSNDEGTVDTSAVKFRFFRRNRNDKLFNVVLEVKPGVRDHLMQEGRVNIGFNRVHVAPFSPFSQCFRCLGFMHTQTKCDKPYRCQYCGSPHDSKSCPEKGDSSRYLCFHCSEQSKRRGGVAVGPHCCHTATDINKCPRLQELRARCDQRIDYGQ